MTTISSININNNLLQINYKGPEIMGYNCYLGSCTKAPKGIYTTLPECQNNCIKILSCKGLTDIYSYLNKSFNSNKGPLLADSLKAANEIYKGATNNKFYNQLEGAEFIALFIQDEINVINNNIAELRFLNLLNAEKAGSKAAAIPYSNSNIMVAYGMTSSTFKAEYFKKNVTNKPFMQLEYIGLETNTELKDGTTSKGRSGYKTVADIQGKLIEIKYIIIATYDSRYTWGLEECNNDNDKYNLYSLSSPTTNNKLRFTHEIGSLCDYSENQLSDIGNGLITNACRKTLFNNDEIFMPNNLAWEGAFINSTSKAVDTKLFNIEHGNIRLNDGSSPFNFVNINKITNAETEYLNQFQNFNVELELIAKIDNVQDDKSFKLDNYNNQQVLIKDFETTKSFTTIFDITPKGCKGYPVEGIISEINYIGNNDIYNGKGTQFSFDGTKSQKTTITFQPGGGSESSFDPLDFITYPIITSSVDTHINIGLNALNNLKAEYLSYDNNTLKADIVNLNPNPPNSHETKVCLKGFWPECNGGTTLWPSNEIKIQQACNMKSYGVIQTSNTGKSTTFPEAKAYYLENQIILSRLDIKQEINSIKSIDLYVGVPPKANYKSVDVTVSIVNIDYPWQTEIQYNEWGRYMHDWGYRSILAVPAGSYNREVKSKGAKYKEKPVLNYKGYITTQNLNNLKSDRFTKNTITFNQGQIYPENMNINTLNTFLLIRANKAIRLRTYTRWEKTSQIYVLNYISLPTTQSSQPDNIQQSFLKSETVGINGQGNPYTTSNMLQNYKALPDIGVRNQFGFYQKWSDVPVLGQTFGFKGSNNDLAAWTCVQTPHYWQTNTISTAACCNTNCISKYNTCKAFSAELLSKFKAECYLVPEKGGQITKGCGCFGVGLSSNKGEAPYHSTCYNECIGSEGMVWNTGKTSYCGKADTTGAGANCKWCNPPVSVNKDPPKSCSTQLPVCTTCDLFKKSTIPGAVKGIANGQNSHLSYGISLPISQQTYGSFLPVPNEIDDMGIYAVINSDAKLGFDVQAPVLYNFPDKEWGNLLIPQFTNNLIVFDPKNKGDGMFTDDYKELDLELYYFIDNNTNNPPDSIPIGNVIAKYNGQSFIAVSCNKYMSTKAAGTSGLINYRNAAYLFNKNDKFQYTNNKLKGVDKTAYIYSTQINIENITVQETNDSKKGIQDYLFKNNEGSRSQYFSFEIKYNKNLSNSDNSDQTTTTNFIYFKNKYEFGYYNFHPIKDEPKFDCFWNYYNFDLCSLFAIIPSNDWKPTNNKDTNSQLLRSGTSLSGGADAWSAKGGASLKDSTWHDYLRGFNNYPGQRNGPTIITNTYKKPSSSSAMGGNMAGITIGGAANTYSIPNWCKSMTDKPEYMENFISFFLTVYNINYIEFDIETSWGDISINTNPEYVFTFIQTLQVKLAKKQLPPIRIFFGASASIDVGECVSGIPPQLQDYNFLVKNNINFIIYTYEAACTNPDKPECGYSFWWQFTQGVTNSLNFTSDEFKRFKRERVYFAVDTWNSAICNIDNTNIPDRNTGTYYNYKACQARMCKNIQDNYAGLFLWAANTTFWTDSSKACPNKGKPVPDGSTSPYYSPEAFMTYTDIWNDTLYNGVNKDNVCQDYSCKDCPKGT